MNTEQTPYQIIPLIHASGERLPCPVERTSRRLLRLDKPGRSMSITDVL